MVSPHTLHIFCHVIDNFGDVGVCWRLSRQFAHEHGLDVTLWVDDLASLKKICAEIDAASDQQKMCGVVVRRWPNDAVVFSTDDVADIAIEAFGCELPSAYVAAMAVRKHKPAWINLEYLSAEAWVDGCHALPSPHTSLPLTKYFFFPGFSEKTGGLPLEQDLFADRDAFQRDPKTVAAFLAVLGVHAPTDVCKVSLFCYPSAPVGALFDAMQADVQPVLCLAPEGVASEAVTAFLQQPAKVGVSATRGALTVQVLPFVDQDDYDRLLWACDLNFVRGEDSFVRAQWAAKPFVWQIYQQDELVHLDKLNAFLTRFTAQMQDSVAHDVLGMFHSWNAADANAVSIATQWRNFRQALPKITAHTQSWAQQLTQQGDLATRLLCFTQKI